jgi:hypothetical protein
MTRLTSQNGGSSATRPSRGHCSVVRDCDQLAPAQRVSLAGARANQITQVLVLPETRQLLKCRRISTKTSEEVVDNKCHKLPS